MNTRVLREGLAQGALAVFELGGRMQFRLSGADRVRYLNGQVSNDVRRLASRPEAFAACLLTARGKMNALLWISAGAEALRLDAEPGDGERREELLMRLERYIISDDAEVTDVTESAGLRHVIGADAAARLGTLPGGVEAIPARRYGVPGVDLHGPREAVAAVALPQGTLAVDAETAETFRIEAGLPRWGAELDETTIPAEARLDEGAIDFHKGCYIGQEVISRIRSVGHVNRLLYGFVSGEPLEAGMTLAGTGEEAPGREAARITSACWSFVLEKWVALGYLRRGIDTGALHNGAQKVEARELPIIA